MKRQMTIVDMVEQNNNGIDSFLTEFMLQLSRCQEIAKSYLFTDEQAKQQLIVRVSKILASEPDL